MSIEPRPMNHDTIFVKCAACPPHKSAAKGAVTPATPLGEEEGSGFFALVAPDILKIFKQILFMYALSQNRQRLCRAVRKAAVAKRTTVMRGSIFAHNRDVAHRAHSCANPAAGAFLLVDIRFLLVRCRFDVKP